MERRKECLIAVILAGWILGLAPAGCSQNQVAPERYASRRNQNDQNQDKEYEHPGNPLKHHYYD